MSWQPTKDIRILKLHPTGAGRVMKVPAGWDATKEELLEACRVAEEHGLNQVVLAMVRQSMGRRVRALGTYGKIIGSERWGYFVAFEVAAVRRFCEGK